MARRGVAVARGLRRLARSPISLEQARQIVGDEVRLRDERFLQSLDRLVWPHPASPARRLLEVAGAEPGDVRALVAEHGVVGALERLRDLGVYVGYEEYQGRREVRRGSAVLSFGPADFFNPIVRGDYMAATGGSRGAGTPVELSFAWQRRQGVQRPLQNEVAGSLGAPSVIWLPVFPSAAGFGAVMKTTAGGHRPERWFSQIPTDLRGVADHKLRANRYIPALNALARTGFPSPEHVPSEEPEPVVRWLAERAGQAGTASITGYASSITSAARWAIDHGVDLSGVVAFPASEPVTSGKLDAMRAAGMRPFPMYAFVPEGTMGLHCPGCDDEEYHLWEQDLAVVGRVRPRGDGSDVSAYCWTSLALEAPRVLLNVENDDYGRIERQVECGCPLGALGLRTRLADIRGISKVVAAGISLEGETFDRLAEVLLPARLGGGPGDYQFVERDSLAGSTVALRIHPRVGPVDEADAVGAVHAGLGGSDTAALARGVWERTGPLAILREPPTATGAGKILAFERISSRPTQSVGST